MLLRLKRLALHPQTVSSMLALIGATMLLGQVIPQQSAELPGRVGTTPEAIAWLIALLQLDRIFTSAWFLLLACWLLLTLTLTTYEQGLKAANRWRNASPLLSERHYHHQQALPMTNGFRSPHDFCHHMERAATSQAVAFGYRLFRTFGVAEDKRTLVFTKNRWSRWGGTLFHAGLAVALAAALWSALSYNRSFCRLKEGDALQGASPVWEQTSKGPLADDLTFDFDLRLQALEVKEQTDGRTQQLLSSVLIEPHVEAARPPTPLAIGSPLSWRGVTFYQTWWHGYVLTCLLRGPDREQTMTSFVLNPPTGEEKVAHGGRSTFPNSVYSLEMRLFPPHSLAVEKRQPVINLTIRDSANRLVFQGDVDPAQPVSIGKDTLHIVDIACWSGISAVRDSGVPLLYGGFLLIIIGAMGMFLLPPREIHLNLQPLKQGIRLRLGGRASAHDAEIDDDMECLMALLAPSPLPATSGHANPSTATSDATP